MISGVFAGDTSAVKFKNKKSLDNFALSSAYTRHVQSTGSVGDGELCLLQLALGDTGRDPIF